MGLRCPCLHLPLLLVLLVLLLATTSHRVCGAAQNAPPENALLKREAAADRREIERQQKRQARGAPRGDSLTATPPTTLETLLERRTSVLLQLDRTQQKTLGAQRQTKPWRA